MKFLSLRTARARVAFKPASYLFSILSSTFAVDYDVKRKIKKKLPLTDIAVEGIKRWMKASKYGSNTFQTFARPRLCRGLIIGTQKKNEKRFFISSPRNKKTHTQHTARQAAAELRKKKAGKKSWRSNKKLKCLRKINKSTNNNEEDYHCCEVEAKNLFRDLIRKIMGRSLRSFIAWVREASDSSSCLALLIRHLHWFTFIYKLIKIKVL